VTLADRPDGAFRVVSWNCEMALDSKADRLISLRPHVAVVQECSRRSSVPGYRQAAWYGRYEHKGLAVFVADQLSASVIDVAADTARWALPVHLAEADLDVVGVWGFTARDEAAPPRGVARDALAGLVPILGRGRAIVLGDFNDGPHFDRDNGQSFRRTWDALLALGYESVYHRTNHIEYGAEPDSTYFQHRRPGAGFFIDHAFAAAPMLASIVSYQVGQSADWMDASDHVPLVADLDLRTLAGCQPEGPY